MSEVLRQDENSAVRCTTRRDPIPAVATTNGRHIRPCNFRTAGQLSNENARALNALHETFARNVTTALGACLGAGFEMGLSSVEQFAFRDFVGSMQPSGYLLPLEIKPFSTTAMLQVSNSLAFPMIDLLLGGTGTSAPDAHELTEIDENVLETVTRLVLRQLETTWQALGASIVAGGCIKPAQVQQLFSPAERMLLLTFEGRTAGRDGVINLLLPPSFGNMMLRQISTVPGKLKSRVVNFPKPTLRERLLDCKFTASVELARLRMTVRDLLGMAPGSVVKLNLPVKSPGSFTIEGREMFAAVPVRSGTQRAAQLVRPATQNQDEDVRP